MDNAKTEQISVIDLKNKTSISDYFIIATCRSTKHASAVADEITQKLKKIGVKCPNPEGRPQCDWVIVDADSVIVHLFRKETRQLYNLEQLWEFNFESEKCKAKIVHSAVGTINESDFMLAESTGSIILGFSTNVEPKVQAMLDKSSIRCETYKIIYEILERIKELLEGLLDPILEERVTGHAEIREIFNLSKQGKIAGCLVNDGKAVRGHNIRVKREDEIVFETTITSLKRFKDDVKEVASGFECGIGFENMEDIKQGDTIEIFTFDKINQTI